MEKISPEKFFRYRSCGSFDIDPTGKLVAFVTNISGAPDLWTIPSSGGWPTQITYNGEIVSHVSFSPRGDVIAYQKDTQGDEQHYIRLITPSGENDEVAVKYDGAQTHFAGWDEKGDGFYVCSNQRNVAAIDVGYFELKSRKVTWLVQDDQQNALQCILPDKRLVIAHFISNDNLPLFVFNPKTGKKKEITPAKGVPCFSGSVSFSKNDKRLYFVTDAGGDVPGIATMNPDGSDFRFVLQGRWEIDNLTLSHDGRIGYYSENRAGRFRPRAYDLARGREVPFSVGKLLATGLTFITGLSPRIDKSDRKMAMVLNTCDSPPSIFVMDLKSKKKALARVTFNDPVGVPKSIFKSPELVSFKARDGIKVDGFFWTPADESLKPPYKTILWFHGGPQAQEIDGYNSWHSFFNSQGYAVFAPNFRGSTGYGRDFNLRIVKDWGGECYYDCKAGMEMLIERGLSRRDRIAAVGGSYGGYMVLRAITHDPDYYRCAVEYFGPANLFSFIETVPPSWRDAAIELVGDPALDKEMLEERSPALHTGRIKAPLLVIQGAKDWRVAKAESEQMVAKMKQSKKHVEYLCIEDAGHGFHRTEQKILVMQRTVDFLEKYME
ncbi:MAG: S9 family peptidase [Planctomycetes bacterium]|nr:S9 family peptidase [Planctomycetota bacterium]